MERRYAQFIAISLAIVLAGQLLQLWLFPKPPRVDFPAVTVGGHAYFLSVTREQGKAPAFSLRQMDATDPGASVLVAPQSDREQDAWAWAEARPLDAQGTLEVHYVRRDGATGTCTVSTAGGVKMQ